MKIQSHANTFITMAILFTFMKHLFSWQIICQVHCTHAGDSLGIKQFYMWTRKCRCVFTRLPPSCLIYCICAPSQPRVFRLRFFSHVFGLPFTSRRHISRISYFSYSFAVDIFRGPAYLGYVLFDVQPGPAPTLAQIFSLMHQH